MSALYGGCPVPNFGNLPHVKKQHNFAQQPADCWIFLLACNII